VVVDVEAGAEPIAAAFALFDAIQVAAGQADVVGYRLAPRAKREVRGFISSSFYGSNRPRVARVLRGDSFEPSSLLRGALCGGSGEIPGPLLEVVGDP
jgi:hypothetical protein